MQPKQSQPYSRCYSSIEAQVSAEHKRVIEQAAALAGLSLSDFVSNSILRTANKMLDNQHSLQLDEQDSEKLVDMILRPEPANQKLKDAFKKYQDDFDGDDTL